MMEEQIRRLKDNQQRALVLAEAALEAARAAVDAVQLIEARLKDMNKELEALKLKAGEGSLGSGDTQVTSGSIKVWPPA